MFQRSIMVFVGQLRPPIFEHHLRINAIVTDYHISRPDPHYIRGFRFATEPNRTNLEAFIAGRNTLIAESNIGRQISDRKQSNCSSLANKEQGATQLAFASTPLNSRNDD